MTPAHVQPLQRGRCRVVDVRLPALPPTNQLLLRRLMLEAERRLYHLQQHGAVDDRRAKLPAPHAHRLEAHVQEVSRG